MINPPVFCIPTGFGIGQFPTSYGALVSLAVLRMEKMSEIFIIT